MRNNRRTQSIKKRRKQRRMKRLVIKMAVIGALCLLVLGIVFVLLVFNRVHKKVTIEAGKTSSIEDLLKRSDEDAYFTADSDDIAKEDGSLDTSVIGEYTVFVKSGWFSHKVKILIQDTVAPNFEVQDVSAYTNGKGLSITAADFVTAEEDATEITYSFGSDIDLGQEGVQTVVIVGTDVGGNETTKEATLTLTVDDEAPTVVGKDFQIFIGDSVAYKTQVSVSDNIDPNPSIEVDTSAVSTDKEGTYPVVYTVSDAAGNQTQFTLKITIMEHAYSQEKLNAMCDQILGGIISDGMSKEAQCRAIFNWIHGHIGYVNSSEKGDWIKSAVDGINNGGGDCYVYFSVSKALLTRAGVKNMDIERIPEGNEMHYWNLVDLEDGNGWRHFDATPRVGHPDLFLRTDEWILEYSRTHDNCHNYDKSKYPDIY